MTRKPNIFLFLIVLISISYTSCVEEYPIDDKDFESKLVVNALFDSDSPWEVEVFQTLQAFNPDIENEIITFARVEVFDQDNEYMYDLFHTSEGKYSNEDKGPSPKRAYSVKVTAPGFHVVTAKGYVPEKSTLLINNFSIIENNDKNDVEVDFAIEDKSQLESYYIWEVIDLDSDENGSSSSSSSQFSDTWIDDLTNNPNDLVNKDREFLGNTSFGDGTYQGSYNSSFDGNRRVVGNVGVTNGIGISTSESFSEDIGNFFDKDPTFDGPGDSYNHTDKDGGVNDSDEDEEGGSSKIIYSYELRVMTISKELYQYYSSLEEYYQKGASTHSSDIPHIFYSNVENGAGIFAGFSESVIRF